MIKPALAKISHFINFSVLKSSRFKKFVFLAYFILVEKLYKIYLEERFWHKKSHELYGVGEENKKYLQNKIYTKICQLPLIKMVEVNHIKFLMLIESDGIIESEIISVGSWNAELLESCDYFIADGSVIIDIGANTGFESIYFAKKFPNCLVYSYEPTSYAYTSLEASRALNYLSNLKTYKLGVGEGSYEIEINSPTANSGNKGAASINNNYDVDETFIKETIQIVPLDSHIEEDVKVSFIKIDTQGYELNVLKGAIKTIKRNKPVILFEHEDEYHNDPLAARKSISDFLHSLNYRIFVHSHYQALTEIDLVNIDYFYGDLFAIPS